MIEVKAIFKTDVYDYSFIGVYCDHEESEVAIRDFETALRWMGVDITSKEIEISDIEV